VIGSVKSTVGHLLTGAGAAALAKVLLAMKAGALPPQANFAQPASGLRYDGGPFRVLREPQPWERRAGAPRRAAVSGFGFGGVNAHLLVEEWTGAGNTATVFAPAPPPAPLAVVAIGAHAGDADSATRFADKALVPA